jgi:predicted  nucleic acid-binding Zn-ribbon protein
MGDAELAPSSAPEGVQALLELVELDRQIEKDKRAAAAIAERVRQQKACIGEVQKHLDEERRLVDTVAEGDRSGYESAPLRAVIAVQTKYEARLLRAQAEEERWALARQDSLEHALEALARRRAAIRTRVPGDLAARYDALARSGRQPAVASDLDGFCSGCHMALPTRFRQELGRTNGMLSCPHCRRILCRVSAGSEPSSSHAPPRTAQPPRAKSKRRKAM